MAEKNTTSTVKTKKHKRMASSSDYQNVTTAFHPHKRNHNRSISNS